MGQRNAMASLVASSMASMPDTPSSGEWMAATLVAVVSVPEEVSQLPEGYLVGASAALALCHLFVRRASGCSASASQSALALREWGATCCYQVDAGTRNTTFEVFGGVVNSAAAGAGPVTQSASNAVVGGLSKLLQAPVGGTAERQGVAADAQKMVRHNAEIWGMHLSKRLI